MDGDGQDDISNEMRLEQPWAENVSASPVRGPFGFVVGQPQAHHRLEPRFPQAGSAASPIRPAASKHKLDAPLRDWINASDGSAAQASTGAVRSTLIEVDSKSVMTVRRILFL